MRKFRIVLVKWRDHSFLDSLVTEQELKRIGQPIMYSVGFLVHEDENRLVLSTAYTSGVENFSDDEFYGGILMISKPAILEIKTIKEIELR